MPKRQKFKKFAPDLFSPHNARAPKYEDAVARTGPPRRRPLRGSDVLLVDNYLDTPGATRLPRVARGPQQQRLRFSTPLREHPGRGVTPRPHQRTPPFPGPQRVCRICSSKLSQVTGATDTVAAETMFLLLLIKRRIPRTAHCDALPKQTSRRLGQAMHLCVRPCATH